MFENQLLISMPLTSEPFFEKVVIYVCEHNDKGSVGLIINCPTTYNLKFIFSQLNIDVSIPEIIGQPVLFGGPISPDRGFIIHKPLTGLNTSKGIGKDICVSTSQDILRLIAKGKGPEDSLVTLGYAGWGAGQLDDEIGQNFWLTCAANEEIVYDTPFEDRWQAAIDSLGFNISDLVINPGSSYQSLN